MLRQATPAGSRDTRDSRVLILPPLVLGFAFSATAVFAAVAALGGSLRSTLDVGTWPLLAALVLFAAADLAFPRVRRTLLRRQTPQSLVGAVPVPLGALLWGLDTGSVVSTYRATAASWAGLVLVFAGWGPWWSGLAYAAGFAVPLAALVASYRPARTGSHSRRPRIASVLAADTDRSVVPALTASARYVRRTAGVLTLVAIAVAVTTGGVG